MAKLQTLLILAVLVVVDASSRTLTANMQVCCKGCCRSVLGMGKVCTCDCGCKDPIPLPGPDQLPSLPSAKTITCDTVAEAGRYAFGLALDTMMARANSAGSPAELPSPQEAAALRACFGGAVDSVRFFFGVAPLDKIRLEPVATAALTGVLFGVPVPTELKFDGSTGAQTFGDRVFFRAQRADVEFSTIAHELVHVEQYFMRGRDLRRMSADYVRGCEFSSRPFGELLAQVKLKT